MPGGEFPGSNANCNFCKIIKRVTIELKNTHFKWWVILMRPYFGEIEWMDGVMFGIFFRHDLYLNAPFRKIALPNCFMKVTPMMIQINARNVICFNVT